MDKAAWSTIVARYQHCSTKRALWQLATTLIPYFLAWYVIYHAKEVSLWLTIPLAVLAGALQMRLFVIFHDCGHGSYFNSRRANDIVGFITGALTFTPYYHWRWQHAIHHGTAGHLDKRGIGDIWTMTVQEYLEASRWSRFAYALSRNPFVLFVLAPLYLFLIRHRFPASEAGPRQRHSVWWMNLVFVGAVASMSWIFGFGPYLLIQSMVLLVAGAAGRLALLRAAPVRRRLLGARRGLGLHGGGAAGQLLLQAAARAAMVLGEHRLPPHPSSQPAHSQLQPAEVPRGDPVLPAGEADHAVGQHELPDVPLLGRAEQEAGRLRPRATDPARAAAARIGARRIIRSDSAVPAAG